MASLQKTTGSRVVRSERKASSPPSPLPEKIALVLQESRWLALIVLAAFLGLALSGYNRADPGWSHAMQGASLHNPAGRSGAWLADLLLYLFGVSSWWWVVFLGYSLLWGFRRLKNRLELDHRSFIFVMIGFFVVLLTSSATSSVATIGTTLTSPASGASGSPATIANGCDGASPAKTRDNNMPSAPG